MTAKTLVKVVAKNQRNEMQNKMAQMLNDAVFESARALIKEDDIDLPESLLEVIKSNGGQVMLERSKRFRGNQSHTIIFHNFINSTIPEMVSETTLNKLFGRGTDIERKFKGCHQFARKAKGYVVVELTTDKNHSYIGRSICSGNDTWNERRGIRIATLDALNKALLDDTDDSNLKNYWSEREDRVFENECKEEVDSIISFVHQEYDNETADFILTELVREITEKNTEKPNQLASQFQVRNNEIRY